MGGYFRNQNFDKIARLKYKFLNFFFRENRIIYIVNDTKRDPDLVSQSQVVYLNDPDVLDLWTAHQEWPSHLIKCTISDN